MKLLLYWDFPTQPSSGFIGNGLKKRKYPWSVSSLGKNISLMAEVRREGPDCFEQNNHILEPRYAEEHLRMQNMANLEACQLRRGN